MFSSSNTRSSGKRQVRAPLRFSDQSKYYSTKSEVTHQPNSCVSTSGGGGTLKSRVTFIETEENSTVNATNNATVDKEAAEILLSMKDSPLYQERLTKYGKICAETGKLCLGCEQDPYDMKWYSQEAWKRWTDAELECPDGIIEYHELTLDTSNLDCWYLEVVDNVIFAEQIYSNDSQSIESRTNDIKDATFKACDSKDTMMYVPGESDQYAIVCEAFPNHESGGYYTSPVYLITSTGTTYPIRGSENPSSDEYNPIIFEVVENLKRSLNGNINSWE